MKLDSPLFDKIRVKPGADRTVKPSCPGCEWPGCANPGVHRAPKGRGKENEYHRFCLDHVKAYNHSYNYFSGMSDDAVTSYQKDAAIGHRPTWKMGSVGGKRSAKPPSNKFRQGVDGAQDPFDVFRHLGGDASASADAKARAKAETERRTVRNAERKALQALGLDEGARKAEIKAKFHELVKRHHPDHNDGDRSMEERLVEVIQAYNYLKSTGVC